MNLLRYPGYLGYNIFISSSENISHYIILGMRFHCSNNNRSIVLLSIGIQEGNVSWNKMCLCVGEGGGGGVAA